MNTLPFIFPSPLLRLNSKLFSSTTQKVQLLFLLPGQVISHTPTMSMLDQLNVVGAALSVLKS